MLQKNTFIVEQFDEIVCSRRLGAVHNWVQVVSDTVERNRILLEVVESEDSGGMWKIVFGKTIVEAERFRSEVGNASVGRNSGSCHDNNVLACL